MSKRPFILYHWSPTKRRKSIMHDGLCPGKRGNLNGNELVDENYRSGCVCFTRSPSASWALSPAMVGKKTNKKCSWDLWMVWSTAADFTKEPKVNDGWQMREYRSMERIPKSKIWLVGTREFIPVKRKKFTICPAVPPDKEDQWRGCLGVDCVSYDPSRDVSLLISKGATIQQHTIKPLNSK